MDEKRQKNSQPTSEIESEIYALISSIINLHSKYQKGIIKESFFHKAVKNALNGLNRINLYLKERELSLTDILIEMKFLNEFNEAIEIINDKSSLNFSDQFGESKHSQISASIKNSILKLPGITSEITSSFITLMDALKLEDIKESKLIDKLFKELKQDIKKFPGLKKFSYQIKQIYKRFLKNKSYFLKDNKFRESIVEDLYEVFKEFQKALNLKP
jgi:hypothetical protein